jgi:hypothetical protein
VFYVYLKLYSYKRREKNKIKKLTKLKEILRYIRVQHVGSKLSTKVLIKILDKKRKEREPPTCVEFNLDYLLLDVGLQGLTWPHNFCRHNYLHRSLAIVFFIHCIKI